MAKKKLPNLNPTEQKIIDKIQDILGEELEPVQEIEWDTKGYAVSEAGAVVGLGLHDLKIDNKKLKKVAELLKELPKLTELLLSENRLTDISSLMELTNLTKLVT